MSEVLDFGLPNSLIPHQRLGPDTDAKDISQCQIQENHAETEPQPVMEALNNVRDERPQNIGQKRNDKEDEHDEPDHEIAAFHFLVCFDTNPG